MHTFRLQPDLNNVNCNSTGTNQGIVLMLVIKIFDVSIFNCFVFPPFCPRTPMRLCLENLQYPIPTPQKFWMKLLDTTMAKTAILLNSENAMGRSQAVRQRVLVPPSLGSNPSAPVSIRNKIIIPLA